MKKLLPLLVLPGFSAAPDVARNHPLDPLTGGELKTMVRVLKAERDISLEKARSRVECSSTKTNSLGDPTGFKLLPNGFFGKDPCLDIPATYPGDGDQ